MSTTVAPRRVFIYGSCVSRDTYEYLPQDRYRLVRYVARQSLVSAFGEHPTALDLSSVASPFQRRMLQGDAAGNLPKVLADDAPDVDLLLWDLADERLGVYALPDGSTVTRSLELIASGLDSQLADTSEFMPFGSDRHFRKWNRCLGALRAHLDETGLFTKTLVVAIPWATATGEGAATPSSFGLTPAKANALYRRYYESIAAVGLPLLRGPAQPVAAADHKWGEAPFHYSPSTYEELASLIDAWASGAEF